MGDHTSPERQCLPCLAPLQTVYGTSRRFAFSFQHDVMWNEKTCRTCCSQTRQMISSASWAFPGFAVKKLKKIYIYIYIYINPIMFSLQVVVLTLICWQNTESPLSAPWWLRGGTSGWILSGLFLQPNGMDLVWETRTHRGRNTFEQQLQETRCEQLTEGQGWESLKNKVSNVFHWHQKAEVVFGRVSNV